MKLIQSRVVFNPNEHTYTLDGKQLSGITSMLGRQLFKNKYDGIPTRILNNAAGRGTLIHQSCELADEGFDVDTVEAKNWAEIKEHYCLHVEESEYLVSDEQHYASCIDKVFRHDDTTFSLGDIKTTYKLDKEYVRWQLSVYAHLFELQNPGAKVAHLYAIWLRGEKAELVTIERISVEEVTKLLDCDSKGEQYTSIVPSADTLPAVYREIENNIIQIEAQLKNLENAKKTLNEEIMKAMVKEGIYQWTGEKVKFIRRKESIRKVFDKERFENDYPGVLSKYEKDSPIKGSLTIKIL